MRGPKDDHRFPEDPPEGAVCVYLMTTAGHVKIGITKNPEWRQLMLQGACPFQIRLEEAYAFPTLAEARAIETELHQAFADFRAYGEWFAIPLSWAQNGLRQKASTTVWSKTKFTNKPRKLTPAEKLELEPMD